MENKVHLNMKKLCGEIIDFDEVQFAGIIDKMGNVIAERFRDGVVPFENDAKRRMLYMQMVLEITMRREFDSSLGPIDYIASYREKNMMISVPIHDHVILVSTSHEAEIKKIISKISSVFPPDSFGGYV